MASITYNLTNETFECTKAIKCTSGCYVKIYNGDECICFNDIDRTKTIDELFTLNDIEWEEEQEGFAAGTGANTETGGAVGYGASTESGGAVGTSAKATYGGGAVGARSEAIYGGGAVGYNAKATYGGGAVGRDAESTTGFAGGNGAKATADGAVQLGNGTNGAANTLQFQGTQIVDDKGKIVSSNLSTVPVNKGGTGATSASAARTNLGITLSNLGAASSLHKHSASDITSGTLPLSRGGTGATSASEALTKLGAVPTTRTINGKSLSSNITLSASDVSADSKGSADTALTKAKQYTDTKISNLINSAPSTLDTLGEIATAMGENQDVVEALDKAIGTKSEVGHTHTVSDLTDTLPITQGGTGATDEETARINLGVQTTEGGAAIGENAATLFYDSLLFKTIPSIGGAVGQNAISGYGFAGGAGSFTGTKSESGEIEEYGSGGAVGLTSETGSGGAVGEGAKSTDGGAVGFNTSTNTGGAVGASASSTTGFAGGQGAKATADGAVQLGNGTNGAANTLQFQGTQIVDDKGKIVSSNLSTVPIEQGGTGAITIDDALENLGILTIGGGVNLGTGATGNNGYPVLSRGGAIGYNAQTANGGAIGYNARTGAGGAIGSGAFVGVKDADKNIVSLDNGGAIGESAETVSGGAVGAEAKSTTGFAGGEGACTINGGAVGEGAMTYFDFVVEEIYNVSDSSLIVSESNSRIILEFITECDYDIETVSLNFANGASCEPINPVISKSIITKNNQSYFKYTYSYYNSNIADECRNQTIEFAIIRYRYTGNGAGGAVGVSAMTSGGAAVGQSTKSNNGAAVGRLAKTTDGGAVGSGAYSEDGFAGGESTETVSGGAVGSGAHSEDGFAGGKNARTVRGGAIGKGATVGGYTYTYETGTVRDINNSSGGAVGLDAISGNGGAVGAYATVYGTRTYRCTNDYKEISEIIEGGTGGAVGKGAISNSGFAGGEGATVGIYKTTENKTDTETVYIDTIESGTGGAIGKGAKADSGFAGGENASIEGNKGGGGAVGLNAKADSGFAGGSNALAERSASVGIGYKASANTTERNTAIGYLSNASALSSVAIGDGAITTGPRAVALGGTTDGTGYEAKATAFSAIQLGVGTNNSENTLQFLSHSISNGSALLSDGADTSEQLEWLDGNVNNEDRRGFFVTTDGEKIRFATSTDEYILGVVSSKNIASFIANTAFNHWYDKYLRDVYGEYILEEKIIPEYTDENGIVHPEYTISEPVLNPEFDETKEYVARMYRPEWAVICFMGQIVVNDDGTCKVNEYCKVSDSGCATAAEKTDINKYRVVKRIDDTHVKIIFK